MLQKISCHRVLTTRASLSLLLAGITSLTPTDFPFSIEEIPTLAQCYPHLGRETYIDIFVPYPALEKPQGMDDVILYLHSSGSTGFPKPIPQTNTTVLHWYSLGISFFRSVMQMLIFSYPCVECVTDFRSPTLRTAVMHLPSFHTLGIIFQLYAPLASVSSISVYPPTSFTDHTKAPVLPTSDNIVEHSKNTQANAAIVVPTFIEIWSSQSENVDWLKTLQFIVSSRCVIQVLLQLMHSRRPLLVVHLLPK
jgi:acyl-CoA synthetase (AMP-forming)/AMP-acid ligase II